MSQSIKQLQALLEAKGGATGNSNSLQDLRTLLSNLNGARGNTLPTDIGQNRSGITCSGHSSLTLPTNLSLKGLWDVGTQLKQQTCSDHVVSAAWCSTRTAVVCECNSRSDTSCGSRTAVSCSCNGRTACDCNNVYIGAFHWDEACSCNTRFTVCNCHNRARCGSRTGVVCECNSRTACDCNTRTDVSCSCNSRTQCECNARCSCNSLTSYS